MATRIYKVLTEAELSEARAVGRFEGSADDRRDGFIHLSAAHQLEGTLAKHFAGRADLLLLTVDVEALGSALRWEPSRGGALFPHLYAPLPMVAVRDIAPLRLDDAGRHHLPEGTVA